MAVRGRAAVGRFVGRSVGRFVVGRFVVVAVALGSWFDRNIPLNAQSIDRLVLGQRSRVIQALTIRHVR